MELEERVARLEEQVVRLADAVRGLEERVARLEEGHGRLEVSCREEARRLERQIWDLLRSVRLR